MIRRVGPALALAFVCLFASSELWAVAPLPAIRWVTEAPPPMVEASGIPPDLLRDLADLGPTDARWARVFPVFAEQGGAGPLPPMAGTWGVNDGNARFTPVFPLARGVRYRGELRLNGEVAAFSLFELPIDTVAATTEVARVFPSASVLPENQLKFYVQFSAPMSRGGVYGHVYLRDAAGRPIDLPFLELDEELWDLAMTRLTLLIDPGRIKRGVKPLQDIGPVFEEGQRYSLTVETGCIDAAGRPLRTAFEKKFSIGAADRTPPDPARWRIHAPAAGTLAPLMVEFDEPLDHALALRMIRVLALGKERRLVAGETALANDEHQWTLTPTQPWPRGNFDLTVERTIEDLAGNNIGKTFDVDLLEQVDRRDEPRSVAVGFEVK
ncbi:MAG: hypothetical protein ABIQ12_15685 [Opitutaceae bacterium]